ncbi:YELLOW STRIPE like 3 [Actinidia rufa]|uniref:YELLOW STRIPE like 3 n=1 Tax=Actinidia rufa TaxID=165716 RepID=A0A7J0G6G5_9ERIC|nr:YELLOW STRIPE like 3 [Actinidia rufa]
MGSVGVDELSQVEREDLEEVTDEREEVKRIPPWKKQITIRGIFASLVIGVIYSVIVMKLNLTTGLVPNLNVSAALLAFVFIRTWTKLLQKAGFVSTPFTRQENTIIQTCAVACYSIAVGGGFGSYLLGLDKRTYEQAGIDTEGNLPGSFKEPGVGWMTGFLFVVSFVGLLALVPLRKIMIIDYKLTYPSGTATAVLINGFHTPKGDKMAKFYFDFSMTYIGAGMICSHLVNLSLLLGAVLSWGVMWPLIRDQKGDWFPGTLPESSMKSLNGYKVFISIALILGDGLYNFLKILIFTSQNMYVSLKKRNPRTFSDDKNQPLDELQRNEAFDVGDPNGEYKAPYAIIYRNMAILGVEGFSALPDHCLQLCYGFFAFAMVANLVRDLSPKKVGKWIPLPMAMAVPFLVGASFAIDMCVGSLIVFVWHKLNSKKAGLMVPAVASGLICGDGLWILPSSILALAKIQPPLCMSFFATKST